jgi:hypothetical protein
LRAAQGVSFAITATCLAVALAICTPAMACERKFAISCGADSGNPDKVIVIENGAYYFLRPHGANGSVHRCSASEIHLDDDSGQMIVDRRSGHYTLRWRDWKGRQRYESGRCKEYALPTG